jgi:hypothetical protein
MSERQATIIIAGSSIAFIIAIVVGSYLLRACCQ